MSARNSAPLAAVLLICAGLALPNDCFALREHVRDGWMLGFSVGTGPGEFTDTEEGASPSESGGLFAMRVGRMIQPKLMIGAELAGWVRSETESDAFETLETTLTLSDLAVAATFFPADPASSLGGLYLRAGIGAAEVKTELKGGAATVSLSESGLGVLLGGGYEFRLTERFVLGAGASFNKLSIGGDVVDSAKFSGVALDLNWYL